MNDKPILHPEEKCAFRQPFPVVDSFGYRSGIYDLWSNCREYAQQHLALLRPSAKRQIAYSFGPKHYKISAVEGCHNIARWFWYLEGHMDWDQRTRVNATQYDNVVIIHYADGWFQNPMATCSTTLMTRIAPWCHEGADMDWVLCQYPHSKNTRKAIYRFLDGHRHYTGLSQPEVNGGWAAAFDGRSQSDVDALLVRKEVVEKMAWLVWEEEGCPIGRDLRHWEEACHRIRPAGEEDRRSHYYAGLREGIYYSRTNNVHNVEYIGGDRYSHRQQTGEDLGPPSDPYDIPVNVGPVVHTSYTTPTPTPIAGVIVAQPCPVVQHESAAVGTNSA